MKHCLDDLDPFALISFPEGLKPPEVSSFINTLTPLEAPVCAFVDSKPKSLAYGIQFATPPQQMKRKSAFPLEETATDRTTEGIQCLLKDGD